LINVLSDLPDIVVPGLGAMRDWRLVFAATGLVGLPIALLMALAREPARQGIRMAPFTAGFGTGMRRFDPAAPATLPPPAQNRNIASAP
jgi:hypothetical protein